MTTSQIGKRRLRKSTAPQTTRIQIATLVLIGIVLLSGAIAAAWFAGQGTISDIFAQLNTVQENPPLWLEVPMVTGKYLLVPAVILVLVVMGIMQVSPQPRTWSRWIVACILMVLTLRYLVWRSLSTLNLDTPLNGVFSLGLFAMELLMLSSSVIQLFLLFKVKDRRHEADELAQNVLSGRYTPTVDLLIPTYDEPDFILRRTVIGCQAIAYPYKKIYLLDDTRRPEIQALAQELGCEYMTRPDNRFAKAGNLNHAITRTTGDLILVFDADFVPTKNFLVRTVGFFQDPRVAMVQTPQSFYNADPIARNLGLENILTPEEEVFYRQIQPMRDGAGSVICSGTSFVVRRSALESMGGFVTDSLSEDYFTGIRLSAQGYQLIYLDEKLSAGLAAENMASQAVQRVRWARGTLQAFFISANPLTIPGLSLLQRLAHLEGLLHWFTSLSRVGFLLMPLAYSFLGVIPLRATAAELMYFFLPYYLVQLSVFSWLNYRSRSAILSDIYSLALCFPLALTVIQAMLRPFSKGFKVTPKGTASDRYSFNWSLAWPLVLMFVATAISLWINLGMCLLWDSWDRYNSPETAAAVKGFGLGWVWSSYNLAMLGIALLILLDVPRPHPHEWFDLRRTVKLRLNLPAEPNGTGRSPSASGGQARFEAYGVDSLRLESVTPTPQVTESLVPDAIVPLLNPNTFWGITTMISEVGAEIALTQAGFPDLISDSLTPVTIEILEENLTLPAQVVRLGFSDEFPTVRVMFEPLPLAQQRRLVEMLFCRPGQWRTHQTPGELQSLLLLFRVLLLPKVLFDRNSDVRAMTVAKV